MVTWVNNLVDCRSAAPDRPEVGYAIEQGSQRVFMVPLQGGAPVLLCLDLSDCLHCRTESAPFETAFHVFVIWSRASSCHRVAARCARLCGV